MVEWNIYELIEFFGVLPEEGEDKTYLSFTVEKHGLRLEVTFYSYVSDVYIDIYQPGADEPSFCTEIKNSPGMTYQKRANGWECLEIAAPHRYHPFFEEEWIIPIGARIQVNPRIKVEMFQPVPKY
jgi:hypothetical protein